MNGLIEKINSMEITKKDVDNKRKEIKNKDTNSSKNQMCLKMLDYFLY